MRKPTAEGRRLDEARAGKRWRRWGTYLAERQWGTVREDYSAGGDAWRYFSYEDAAARAYRWGEDGLLGLCDNRGLVAFSTAFWNGKDRLLKERLFGLTGPEGNHGEDVKEVYFTTDATPTTSYARALYKYPQAEFPYQALREASAHASREAPEPELWDFGVFEGGAYFDVAIEYGKADVEDVLARITVTNRGQNRATLHVLPTVWLRNSWDFAKTAPDGSIQRATENSMLLEQTHLGKRTVFFEGAKELLFTGNETNESKLYGIKNRHPYTKDAFHRYVIGHEAGAVDPRGTGTKAAAHYVFDLGPGESQVVRVRMFEEQYGPPFGDFDAVMDLRRREADEFYASLLSPEIKAREAAIFRQAMAGLLWNRQFYSFDVERWLRGDPAFPAPPAARFRGRNREWRHLYNSEVLSVPDKWEYPWYAAWDLSFHAIPLALSDPEFAKQQLTLLTREWYMHPNGQLPAYEWSFGDVNPPVHAWAARRVFQIEKRTTGRADRAFLESVFHKLMLNFTWWVNRKDAAGNNVFEGGFLGLDNIGVFDRSNDLPAGAALEQADATSWMGMYCLNLLSIALELADENPSYQDVANKFFEHFLYIAHAMNGKAREADDTAGRVSLWDEKDGFFYDVLHLEGGRAVPLRARSIIGAMPLFAVGTLEPSQCERFPAFTKRLRWFLANRPELCAHLGKDAPLASGDFSKRQLLALVGRERLVRILARLLDEDEFLSPHGIRALSKAHKDEPFAIELDGQVRWIGYEPGESRSGLFGGNSNWRGPIWMPVNYLLVEALQKHHYFYGDTLKVECPTGSGNMMTLWEVASEISRRLIGLFLPGEDGRTPAHAAYASLEQDPHFREAISFYEYFHGDTGKGLGASHQTGWTALVAKLVEQSRLTRDHDGAR